MTQPSIAVTASSNKLKPQAEQLAKDLSLSYIDMPSSTQQTDHLYLLTLTPDYIGLIKPQDKTFQPFYINFLAGDLTYRIEHAGLKKEALAKALGCHPKEKPFIIDATAGLGRDSYVLASLGFNITMLEKSTILHALLKDAMLRGKKSPTTSAIIDRMELFHTDAIAWLNNQSYTRQPDVIYLDPMFPERKKSASVKKEMIILQELLGNDMDREKMLETALHHTKKRVVVKQPKNVAKIGENEANYSLTGRSCRFDIYLAN